MSETAYLATQSLSSPPRSLTTIDRSIPPLSGGAATTISSGVPFDRGELGNIDLNFRMGDIVRSASSAESAPDLTCLAKRAFRARVKPSRRWVKPVLRVGTGELVTGC